MDSPVVLMFTEWVEVGEGDNTRWIPGDLIGINLATVTSFRPHRDSGGTEFFFAASFERRVVQVKTEAMAQFLTDAGVSVIGIFAPDVADKLLTQVRDPEGWKRRGNK